MQLWEISFYAVKLLLYNKSNNKNKIIIIIAIRKNSNSSSNSYNNILDLINDTIKSYSMISFFNKISI